MAAASTRLFSLAVYQVEGQRSHMCGRQSDGLTGSRAILSQLSVSKQTLGDCCRRDGTERDRDVIKTGEYRDQEQSKTLNVS